MNQIRPLWTALDRSGPLWTALGLSGRISAMVRALIGRGAMWFDSAGILHKREKGATLDNKPPVIVRRPIKYYGPAGFRFTKKFDEPFGGNESK